VRRWALISLQAAILTFGFCIAFAAPYKQMLDDPLRFRGHAGAETAREGLDAVVIGLFAPGEEAGAVARDLNRGVALAVARANGEGGLRGTPFRVARRWDDNPWGAGSKEMIRLVYRDRSWAVIGFTNGAGHIAEQIAAKAYLPVLSPVSSDPTLTHARLPWIFRLPPDGAAQARILIEEGVVPRGLKRVGMVTSTDHDGRRAAAGLRSAMERFGVPAAFHLSVEADLPDLRQAARRIRDFSPDGLVLRLPPVLVVRLLQALGESGDSFPIFLPWIPGLSEADLRGAYRGTIVAVEPFSRSRGDGALADFERAYRDRFDSPPSASAAYGYDAARMVVAAVRSAGLTRSGVRDALAAQSGYRGASGMIDWDNGGGNRAQPVLRLLPGSPEQDKQLMRNGGKTSMDSPNRNLIPDGGPR